MGTVSCSQSRISFGSENTQAYNIFSFSNIDIMIRTIQALLCAVIFLSGLEEALLAQRRLYVGNQSFALFQEATDFSSAKTSCEDLRGQLCLFGMDRALTSLLRGFSGRFWLSSTNRTTEGAAAGLQTCVSVSVTMPDNITLLGTQCSDKLDGFVCQSTFQEPCGRLQTDTGTQARYVTHDGVEVSDSETFPPGTVAVVEKVGGKYLDSKHVCIMRTWMQAPWNCEVMNGGCEHSCNDTTDACGCPARHTLHPNNITCSKEPCADCAQQCAQEGDSYVCKCTSGYRLAQDRKSCVDVDECAEEDPCTGEGEECENTQGGFECKCKDDFMEEDGVCVDVSICDKCEHMLCNKFNRVYQCICRNGFRVSPKDPTRCEKHCTERDCPATCIPNPDVKKKDMQQCFCPDGYIQDVRNNTTFCTDIDECEVEKQCDHKCENFFGGYRCLCDKGYYLDDDHTCLRVDEEENGSGSSPSYPTPASSLPAAVPFYIKTGSVLGITVFVGLCMALMYFLARNMAKRCGKFEFASLKSPDIDIFSLQQVTTDTYKRLSFDRQFKNDSQRL